METQRSAMQAQPSREKRACPLCGDDGVTTFQHRHTFIYGSGESAFELTVDLPVRRCDPCDSEFLDHVAEDLKHEALCRHFGVLSPAEIRRIREQHRMTRAKFAEVTGLGEASLNRWENGINIQTHAYDRYLRLLAIPGIMQHLENLETEEPLRPSTSSPGEKRFRTLEVTDIRRRKQQGFRLRLAA